MYSQLITVICLKLCQKKSLTLRGVNTEDCACHCCSRIHSCICQCVTSVQFTALLWQSHYTDYTGISLLPLSLWDASLNSCAVTYGFMTWRLLLWLISLLTIQYAAVTWCAKQEHVVT